MKFGRKGQGAMEYLMTYGWAILVVMVVGIVMWQMGVFNVGGSSPPRVSGANYQRPIDATLRFDDTGNRVYLSLVNGEPGQITFSGVASIWVGTTAATDVELNGVTMAAAQTVQQGAKYDLDASVLIGNPGDTANIRIKYTYTVSIAGVSRTRTEEMVGQGPVEA